MSSDSKTIPEDNTDSEIIQEPRPDDGAGGMCLHWDDHRILSIMEIRRGQGLPDYEVLIGSPFDQWKILGNSVARPKALALGISLRTAWMANTAKPEPSADRVDVAVSGIGDDRKTEKPGVASSGEAARNGWSAKDMLNRLSATLASPRALVSAISDTIKEPLTNGDHLLAPTPESQPWKNVDAVKLCQTGFEHSREGNSSANGTSRLKPYRLEQEETSSASDISTTMAHSMYTDYAPENYYPKSLRGSSARPDQPTRRVALEKTISEVSITKTSTVLQERFESI